MSLFLLRTVFVTALSLEETDLLDFVVFAHVVWLDLAFGGLGFGLGVEGFEL